eukprot:comp18823_c0_seq1/m.20807 comp18823_c0_seq1/g.20807  ORF comp18823_c0_seq1/g.20807 comp18823_c0_seq1/m.20807 type:complete len:413 (-) comp18823_c0_seq1:448-1686(-)
MLTPQNSSDVALMNHEEKKRKRKQRQIIAIVVFLLVVAGGAGVAIYFLKQGGSEPSVNESSVCPSEVYKARPNAGNKFTDVFCQSNCITNTSTYPCVSGNLSSVCACAPRSDYTESTCLQGVRKCEDDQRYAAWPRANVTDAWCRNTCGEGGKECTCNLCRCVDVCPAGMRVAVSVDFDNHEPNGMAYSSEMALDDFGSMVAPQGNFSNNKMVLDPHGGTAMQVIYRKGCAGGKCTGRWKTPLKFGPVEEAYLSFHVGFSLDFVWVKGGKLPATLCGGTCPTANGKPTGYDGWTNTISWRPGGVPTNYAYHAGQVDNMSGDNFPFNAKFIPGALHHVTMRVKMNTPGVSDGILETWLDGNKAYSTNQMLFRMTKDIAIDTFLWTTFFGGMSSDWAPGDNVDAIYDDYVICTP